MKTVGLSAAMGPLAMAGTPDARHRPNVVLVLTDDQGYGDVGCLGDSVVRTPNLDRIHGESCRLTDFHVSPTCSPTRAALMTGRYSNRTGVWHTIGGRSLLRRDEVTVADLFRCAGYATGVFGKWHLGDNYPFRPQDRGFDEVLVHGGGGVGQTPDYWGNDYFDDTYRHNGEAVPFKGYCTDVWFDGAMHFIERHRDRPFFCYLPTNAPHTPLHVADRYSAPYRALGCSEAQARFLGMCENIDENMGRLVGHLDNLGLRDNTILVFMTDNGTAGEDPGAMRGRKGAPYEGGHRVPCFIRWPGGPVVRGLDVTQLTAHIDLLPTLTDLCGIPLPEGLRLDGSSLAPLLADPSAPWPGRTLVTDSQRVEHPRKWRGCCVMEGRWRLVNGKELYDLSVDPHQERDVSGEDAGVVARLRAAYEAWWADLAPGFDTPCRIVVGTPAEPVTQLTCHDWREAGDLVPWNQDMVRSGPEMNGFWDIEVAEAGTYRFSLRRWPRELDEAITAPGPGSAIPAERARIRVGAYEASRTVGPEDRAVTFEADLPAGPARLQTWFEAPDVTSRGAYYVEARRVYPGGKESL